MRLRSRIANSNTLCTLKILDFCNRITIFPRIILNFVRYDADLKIQQAYLELYNRPNYVTFKSVYGQNGC